jgi:hypothetical protein
MATCVSKLPSWRTDSRGAPERFGSVGHEPRVVCVLRCREGAVRAARALIPAREYSRARGSTGNGDMGRALSPSPVLFEP